MSSCQKSHRSTQHSAQWRRKLCASAADYKCWCRNKTRLQDYSAPHPQSARSSHQINIVWSDNEKNPENKIDMIVFWGSGQNDESVLSNPKKDPKLTKETDFSDPLAPAPAVPAELVIIISAQGGSHTTE